MTKKKAVICTILFSIIIFSIVVVSMCLKPYESEKSLFHIFCTFIVGRWLGECIGKFYDWLRKNN